MKFFEECFKCFLLEEQYQAIELNPNRLKMNNLYQQLANIDIKNFDDDYVQSDEELRDDFEISGSYSWGLLDRTDNEFKGYILGYSPDTYDINNNRKEFQKILDSNDQRLKFYSNFNIQSSSDIIFKDLSTSNGFYVSSLAINGEARKTPSAGRMIYNFINGLKTKGIKYIIFDGMQDTLNIFLNPDGTPNEKRLNSYNIKLVLTFPSDEDRLFSLMMINN
jgi:hypothetical protein